MYLMSGFNTQTDFWTVALYRLVLSAGLPFLFLPITTAGYFGVPPDKNDQASAMINMSRNVGGSVGISLLSTRLSRLSQTNQNVLTGHANPYNPAFRHALAALKSAGASLHQAYAVIYQTIQAQARMLAYADDFRLLAILFICMVPLTVLLRRKPR